MPFYDPDVVAEAKKLDLLTYLQNYEPQELVHVSGNVYCTKTHDSLRISNGKWCWFSQGIGGKSALDYLIKVNGYSFLEAMERIVGQAAAKPPVVVSSEVKEKPKTLLLPEKYRYAEYAASYLEKRGISPELISFCISTGRMYESNPYHNVVFVGFDKQGKARFACQRGIYDTRFHGDVNGSAYLTESIHQDGTIDPEVKEQVTGELKKYFRPEFLNRIDDIVVFSPLTESQISGIIDIAAKAIADRLVDREITMGLTDAAKAFIAQASYDPAYGARPVKRYLQKNLETQLAEMLIRGTLSDGQHVTIDSDGTKLTFAVDSGAAQAS